MAYGYNNIQFPGIKGKPKFLDDLDYDHSSLEAYLKGFIEQNALYYIPKPNKTANYLRLIEGHIPELVEKASESKEWADFWDEWIAPIMRESGKVIAWKDILTQYEENSEEWSQFPSRVKDTKYFSPKSPINTDGRAFKRLVVEMETTSVVEDFDGNLQGYPKSKLKDILKDLDEQREKLEQGSDEEERLFKIIQDIEDINSKDTRTKGAQISIPIKLVLSNILDVNQKSMDGDLEFALELVQIPQGEKIFKPDTIATYKTSGNKNARTFYRAEYDPSDVNNKIVIDNYLKPPYVLKEGNFDDTVEEILKIIPSQKEYADQAKIQILPLDYKFPEVQSRLELNQINLRNPNSLKQRAARMDVDSADDYVLLLSKILDPNFEDLLNPKRDPDALVKVPDRIANRQIMLPIDLFKFKIAESRDNSDALLKTAKAQKLNTQIPGRGVVQQFVQSVLTKQEQLDKTYIGPRTIHAIKTQNPTKLANYFEVNRSGQFAIIPEKSSTGGGKRGLRWEHTLPMNDIGEILQEIYNEMIEEKKSKKEIISALSNTARNLYSTTFIDKLDDNDFNTSGVRTTAGKDWLDKNVPNIKQGKFDDIDFFDRYKLSGVVGQPQPVQDVFNELGDGNKIPLGVTYQQLAKYEKKLGRLGETKRPISLLDLLK